MTTGASGGATVPPGTDPNHPPTSGWLPRVAAGTVLVVVLAVAWLLWAGERPTVRLEAVTPGASAVLPSPPTEISLTFTASPKLVERHVTVAGPDGAVVASGEPQLDGLRAVLPLTATTTGAYSIAYHLRLSDGRELSGLSRFTVDPAAAQQPGAAPTSDTDGHEHASPEGWNLALLGVDVVLILAVLLVMLPRRRAARP
ncbi:copper resistance CopC family protein [Micromonospora sp. NPDC003944]